MEVRVPQGELIDLFKHCDLRSRCKVRRVCSYWKHVVTLPTVNETVLVDRQALIVRNVRSRWKQWLKDGFPETPPVDGFYDNTLVYGWYDGHATPVSHAPFRLRRGDEPVARLTDHQRGGLLGPHVQTFIYDGKNDREGHWRFYDFVLKRMIHSIGFYCSGVKHVIFWHLGVQCGTTPFIRENFGDCKPSLFPRPEMVTILDSKFILAEVIIGNKFVHIEGRASVWQDHGQTDQQYFAEMTACTPAQIAWVAKYAPRLPDKYHRWLREKVHILRRFGPHGNAGSAVSLRLPEFPKVDYAKMDGLLLRILAFCIRRERDFVARAGGLEEATVE